ncbi:hypothetical protein [Sphingorhabdus sp.]|uniref:hypothetical protein n=1 Tax=Sphingorhabdus sp. TaxID=1902408 RepID=UPI003983D893
MATILDIAGKPLPPRNQSKSRLRAQDFRDLLKVMIVLALIIMGYFTFAPNNGSAQSAQNTPQQITRAG